MACRIDFNCMPRIFMDKVPLTEAEIHRAAKSLREEAVNRLSAGVTPPLNQVNYPRPTSLVDRLQSKRGDALITCVALGVVVALSMLIHPIDWRMAIGCLSAGIGMALGGLMERRGYVAFGVLAFLAATGLAVWFIVKFGTIGPMVWVQSLPLMGIGAFGSAYVLFDKFGFKEWDFVVRPSDR